MNKYISLDVESGGIGLQYSLLTAYFAILDENLNITADLNLLVKPDDGIYHITPRAMEINKINLIEHDKVAIPYKKAGTLLYKFLEGNRGEHSLVSLGHGVCFDIDFICDKLISKGSWNAFISHHYLDTCVIAKFLQDCGSIAKEQSLSLSNLREYFNIKIDGMSHDAKVDTLVSIEVYKKFKEIMNHKFGPIRDLPAKDVLIFDETLEKKCGVERCLAWPGGGGF